MERDRGWIIVKTNDVEFLLPVTKETKAKYYIDEAKSAEVRNDLYGCKSWLLTGVSIVPDSFELQYQLYMFEKRRKNIPEIAWNFEAMYRKFPKDMETEITTMADAVRNLHMTHTHELGDEEKFFIAVFNALPKHFQMEVLLSRTEKTVAHYEKCQIMLLLVKLFPDTVSQHGADLLFNLIGYDSDVYSVFRKLLVTELIPAVLHLRKDWSSNKIPQIHEILNQCIEYYVMATEGSELSFRDRWTKLMKLVDHIGIMLHWKVSPFYQDFSGPGSIENLYKKLVSAFSDRNDRQPNELAYTAAVFFLVCITSYNEMRYERGPSKFGGKKKLVLVEVFTPSPSSAASESKLPVLLTSSHSSSVQINETHLMSYFLTASKIWQMVNQTKGPEEKEFFTILYTMKSLDFENWDVFLDFSVDYRTYCGQNYSPDASIIKNPSQLASFHCALNNSKMAAEFAIKAATDLVDSEVGVKIKEESQPVEVVNAENNGVSIGNHREDVSFFNHHLYTLDSKGSFLPQRRVHFLSDNHSEIVAYSANVLIKCLYELLEDNSTAHDDLTLGHLLTLIQLEWPSPPMEMIFLRILDIIRRKGSFRYCPYFGDFMLESDFLEEFMSMANNGSKSILLDIWPAVTGTVTGSSRRMATRGVDKGAKNDFRQSMKRQMMKNGQVNLEKLILKFLRLYKFDILGCFDKPISYKKHA